MHDVKNDASRATLSQIPVVLLAQNAVQPRIRTPGVTPKSTLWLSRALARQDTRRNARGLSMEEEQREEQGVDDIAVETEGLLVLVGAGMAMKGAEANK